MDVRAVELNTALTLIHILLICQFMNDFPFVIVETKQMSYMIWGVLGQILFAMILLSYHQVAMGQIWRFYLDDEVRDVFLRFGMIVVVGANVIYGSCCVFLIVYFVGHPKNAIVYSVLVLESRFCWFSPLSGAIWPRSFPLNSSPRVSQLY